MHEVVLIVCNTFCRVYEENTTIFRWRNRLVVFITRQVIYGPGLHRLLPRIPGVCRSYCGHIQNTGCYWFNSVVIMGYVPLGAGFYKQGVRSSLSSGSTRWLFVNMLLGSLTVWSCVVLSDVSNPSNMAGCSRQP